MANKILKESFLPSIQKLEVFTRGLATGKLIGTYRSSFKGKGLDFEGYRAYAPDDDASLIDWKASVRTNDVLIRLFTEERNLNVFLLMDVNSSMLYGSSANKLKILYAAELSASLCYAILKAKDSIGYGLFNDRLTTYEMPSLEPRQFYKFYNTLLDTKNYGGNYDLSAVLDELIGILPERTIVIIISDFIGVKGDWEEKLGTASKKFEVIGLMVRDLFDRTLPGDEINLLVEHPQSNEQLLINPNDAKRSYELHAREQEEYVSRIFKKNKCDILMLTTDKSFVKPLFGFFKMRERRWR